MARTRIKICGVTRPEDAELAVEMGADYLGLNFFPKSPRFLGIDEARRIAQGVRGRIQLVGVFVNAAAAAVAEVERDVGLDLLQFHGDESVDEIAPFAKKAIKVLRLGSRPAHDALDSWREVWGFLVEGRLQRLYGGSGEPWRYEMIDALPRTKPVFLAGGLTAETVGGAVQATGAWGVDVASGIESSPGIKDEKLLHRFISEVRAVDGQEE